MRTNGRTLTFVLTVAMAVSSGLASTRAVSAQEKKPAQAVTSAPEKKPTAPVSGAENKPPAAATSTPERKPVASTVEKKPVTGAVAADKGEHRDKGDHGGRVNINTADVKQLMSLAGVQRKTAEKIVEYRQSHGGFKKPEEIVKVEGIGRALFEKNRTRIVTQ